ncbi:SSS family solute:Na+ symporter [Lewinella marina]|uniref:Sodium/glucose cotransporter n=1 Tax=Neolewinella marina TaxID=438751 RepID=A0A2G0CE32_9BACT|nr:sodium/solute symporter [Neolewinella marina]NJB87455.1 SSS family solute:Na+ symporter [Neolewinella marina]PHK98236.1 sodium/glucose cotransporter [Neolewinella marina]
MQLGQLGTIDTVIFGAYIIGVIVFGIWIANREKTSTASDYFLASRSLPWWAVGGSLIASNISAEQIIGMNGSGFELGLAIAAYELMAAITLILVAKFFLPVFLKKEIYTMPQFLEDRYNGTVRTIMSVFWIALFVFVNIATVIYLGALAIETLLGVDLIYGIIGLVLYSASFSIFGGLKAVVWTDVVQVVVLMLGGTIAAYGILSVVGDGSVFTGIANLYQALPGHFEMLFEPGDTYLDVANAHELSTGVTPYGEPTDLEPGAEVKSSFQLLPGMALLLGGMWITNSYYWGNNQYIIQRALAAKDLPEAQRGVAFAAFMKLFIPFFAVLPGIAAWYLLREQDPANLPITKADQAFPWVLANYVGVGFTGLTFAALVAAIGSSVSSMVNSTSTIFTMDIYNKFINPGATEGRQVKVGQISAAAALLIGAAVAPALANAGQVFQVIQEYTGFISPGVLTVFIFGFFYRRGTAQAALVVVLASVPLSWAFQQLMPDLPFLDRMAFIFLISALLMVVISQFTGRTKAEAAAEGGFNAEEKRQMGEKVIKDVKLRNGLSVAVIGIGLATGVRLLLQPVPGVPLSMSIIFIILSLVVIALIYTDKTADDYKAIDLHPSLFRTRMGFNIAALAIILLLTFIYTWLA